VGWRYEIWIFRVFITYIHGSYDIVEKLDALVGRLRVLGRESSRACRSLRILR